MDFTMTKPCPKCPFRTDVPAYLNGPRAQEIVHSIVGQQQQFPCHQTTEHDDDSEYVPGDGEQHCAGAMILLEKIEQPNQLMRISERCGIYDANKLDMTQPVFDTPEEFIRHHGGVDEDHVAETCDIVDADCLAPAGWMEGSVIVHNEFPEGEVTECPHGCGNMVCENCSCYCTE